MITFLFKLLLYSIVLSPIIAFIFCVSFDTPFVNAICYPINYLTDRNLITFIHLYFEHFVIASIKIIIKAIWHMGLFMIDCIT